MRLFLVGLSLASKPESNPPFKSPHPFKLGDSKHRGFVLCDEPGKSLGCQSISESSFLWMWCRGILSILCGSSKRPLVHPKAVGNPSGFASHPQAGAWILGTGSGMTSGNVQGLELPLVHPPVAAGAVALPCWAAKSESCEAQCKQPLQLG